MIPALIALFIFIVAVMITLELFAVSRSIMTPDEILEKFPFYLWHRMIEQQGFGIMMIFSAPAVFVAEFAVAGILRCAIHGR